MQQIDLFFVFPGFGLAGWGPKSKRVSLDLQIKVLLWEYRHAKEGELPVDFELVGWSRAPARVHQGIAELERKKKKKGVTWHREAHFRASGRAYQEEHSLLQAFPRQLTEAAQSDELLSVRQKKKKGGADG